MFQKAMKWVLVFQLAFAPSFLLAGDTRTNLSQGLIRKYSAQMAEDREVVSLWLEGAQAVEEGRTDELPGYDKNAFQIANQRIEIGDEVYDLNENQLEIPDVSFTGLKVVYDEERRELIFEGYRGLNERGENGKLVARQIIPDVNISSMAKDEEMIQIVDSSGNLHAIDMAYVSLNVFKNWIPMAKNIWSPQREQAGEYEIRFATPGTRPPAIDEANDDIVLPVNEQGEVDMRAGDAIVYRVNATEKELVGVFSRYTTYERLNIMYEYLYKMLMLYFPSNLSPRRIKALEKIDERATKVEAYESQIQTIPQVIRNAIRNFGEEQIKSIFGPIKAYDASEETGAYTANQARSSRQFQQLKSSHWLSSFEVLKSKADAQSEELVQLLGDDKIEPLHKEELAYRKKLLDEMREAGDFSGIWKNVYQESELNLGAKYNNKKVERETLLKKITEKLHLRKLIPLGAVLGGFWGFPMAYEASETMQQMQVLSWMYQQMPEVVKDADYRLPLLASTMALLAIWPGAVSYSWAVGRGLKVTSMALQKSVSAIGRTIRDLSHKWSDLTNWQRITSYGMRVFGTLIYPPARLLVQHIVRHPGMITALSARLNPFKKIDPSSAIGRELGLEKSMYVGLTNPFKFGNSMKKHRDQQAKLQAILADRKQQVDNMAWILAATLVSEQEGIDAATIDLVAKGQIDPANLKSAFKDGKTKRLWVDTQERIRKYLDGVGEGYFNSDLGGIDPERLDDFHQFALEIAKSLKGQNKNDILLKNLWVNSRMALQKSTDVLFNFGLADSKFLRTVFTNEDISKQTQRGFVSDHIMVALIYALIGERADLSQPHELAADPNGILWTNGPHWSDVMLNTYAHFFSAGSKRALVYQTVKPENSDNYIPEEYMWADEVERQEGFFKSAYKWVTNVADTRKSNLGYFAVKGFFKRFNTITAGLYMNVLVRMSMGDQSFGNAVMGFMLFLLAGTWVFGWPWDIIDRGAVGEGERIRANQAEFKAIIAEISEVLRDDNEERLQRNLEPVLNKLMALYGKSNSNGLKVLESMAEGKVFDEIKEAVDEDSMIAMGLAAQLQLDITNEETKEALILHMAKSGVDKNELRKMSARALQEYAFKEFPIYNEAHPAISWIATSVFGALGTTIMAIPLSVNSFDDDVSAAKRAAEDPSVDPNDYYLSPEVLVMWAGISAAGFTAAYAVFGKDGLWSKFLTNFGKWAAKFKKPKKCDDYFKKAS